MHRRIDTQTRLHASYLAEISKRLSLPVREDRSLRLVPVRTGPFWPGLVGRNHCRFHYLPESEQVLRHSRQGLCPQAAPRLSQRCAMPFAWLSDQAASFTVPRTPFFDGGKRRNVLSVSGSWMVTVFCSTEMRPSALKADSVRLTVSSVRPR